MEQELTRPKIKMWLDDNRRCPFIGNWKHVINYDEAISLMSKYDIEEAWLDHDLAFAHYDVSGTRKSKEKTGDDVLKYMIKHGQLPKAVRVHSLNPVGSVKMAKRIAKYFGETYYEKYLYSYLKIQERLKV